MLGDLSCWMALVWNFAVMVSAADSSVRGELFDSLLALPRVKRGQE